MSPGVNRRELLRIAIAYRIHRRKTYDVQAKRRFWVRQLFAERETRGEFRRVFQFLKSQDTELFRSYMRMDRDTFDRLLSLLEPAIHKNGGNSREPISAEERLVLTLRYLSTGDSQVSLMFSFCIGKSTVSKIIRETCQALWDILQPIYMSMPQSADEWKAIADKFEEQWNLPHVLGAIDGKHICIQKPDNGGSLYFCYKYFHSTVLLACCDADYAFTYVNIGNYGGTNDAAVFNSSPLYKDLDSGEFPFPEPEEIGGRDVPYYFIGDDIFALKTWLMKPYPGRQISQQQRIFNYRLSRARRVIENAFGILASKWRVFRRPIIAAVPTVDLIVKATTCLHNFLIKTAGSNYIQRGTLDEDSSGSLREGSWRDEIKGDRCLDRMRHQGSNNPSFKAKDQRDFLCDYVNSDDGSVPWQNAYASYAPTY